MRVIGVTMTIARRITGTRRRKKKVRKFEGKMKSKMIREILHRI